MRNTLMLAACAALMSGGWAHAATPAPESASVYIIAPQDGATVKSPVRVQFGLESMGVAPAGVAKENTGHHHLLIDVEELPPLELPLPKDEQHLHFGGGQTEVMLELEPGEHTLQLILGDANHFPHVPPVMSEKITVTVE